MPTAAIIDFWLSGQWDVFPSDVLGIIALKDPGISERGLRDPGLVGAGVGGAPSSLRALRDPGLGRDALRDPGAPKP